jgi:F-box domain
MKGKHAGSPLSLKIDCFGFLSLPPEIIDNITARLDFQSLQVLRCCCKKLGEWTDPLLFRILRVRFRLRDLTSLQLIAANDHLRHFVHTLVYVGDQYCAYATFSGWKNALGIVDRSPTPAYDRSTPAEPPPWTLEHAQWRGYRRYQQVRKEQKVS